MKTVNGIYNNIEESTYFLEIQGFRIYFSSEYLMNKFEARFLNYISEETQKLIIKYSIPENSKYIPELFEILLFSFYRKIERRGRRIYKKENGEWLRVQV